MFCGLAFEMSGLEQLWHLGPEAKDKPEEPRVPSAMPVTLCLDRQLERHRGRKTLVR